jgi:hypothetical protein
MLDERQKMRRNARCKSGAMRAGGELDDGSGCRFCCSLSSKSIATFRISAFFMARIGVIDSAIA